MTDSTIKVGKRLVSALLLSIFVILSLYFLNAESIVNEGRMLAGNPVLLILIMISYFAAFLARGIAWKLYLHNSVSLRSCLYGLFYSLLLNHLLPVKAGDLARIGIVKARENHLTAQEAVHSVVVLRGLDTAILFAMGIAGLVILDLPVNNLFLVGLIALGLMAAALLYFRFRGFFDSQLEMMKQGFKGKQGLLIILLTMASWMLEAGIIYGVLYSFGQGLDWIQSIWVNSITVAGQIFQITPGGIASYEAIMVFALGALAIPGETAYSAAVITHGLKFLFAFLAGGLTVAAYPVPLHVLKKWLKRKEN